MAIRDIFLRLVGEPDAATIAAIDKCVAVARDLGARVTVMAIEEDLPVRPKVMISDDLDNTAAAEAVRITLRGPRLPGFSSDSILQKHAPTCRVDADRSRFACSFGKKRLYTASTRSGLERR